MAKNRSGSKEEGRLNFDKNWSGSKEEARVNFDENWSGSKEEGRLNFDENWSDSKEERTEAPQGCKAYLCIGVSLVRPQR